MFRKHGSNAIILVLSVFLFSNFSFAMILPETPDGKIGKNYQFYGLLSTGTGITKKIFDFSTGFMNFGLRSNLGLDLFDFGLFYNQISGFKGLSADIKYAFIRNDNFSSCLDIAVSKPFSDNWIIKTGPALNIKLISLFELILSSYFIYSFYEMKTQNEISFPSGYSMYFYTGVEFVPPFAIDNTIALGCGYLYLPDKLNDNQKFFSQLYINLFARHAFCEPKIEKKNMSVNNIIKDKKQEDAINANILVAKELIKIKEHKKAILILSDALYLFPDNFTLNLLLADCYLNTGEKIKAFIYYKKASEINAVNLNLKEFLKNLEMEIKNENK